MNITEDFYSKPAKLSPAYSLYKKPDIKQRGSGLNKFLDFIEMGLGGQEIVAKRRKREKELREKYKHYGYKGPFPAAMYANL